MGRSNRTVRAGPPVNDLVTRAGKGDKQAWDALVERYAPLIWSICRRHRLSSADADDTSQRVWLQLVSELDKVRDPAALPARLATTTHRECGNIRRVTRRSQALSRVLDAGHVPGQQAGVIEQELLVAERHAALREAFTRLPPCCQRLIAVLIEDPPVPYAEISARLGIPVGSIGPSRSRCLEKLRCDPAIAALIHAEAASAAGDHPHRQRCLKDHRLRTGAQMPARSAIRVSARPVQPARRSS
jgi:RNA polymerase sigma factor (sigma-70 family)